MSARDPNPQVIGGGADFLASQGVKVEVGLLEAPARRLNEAWFKWVITGRPWVMAKAACSLDGKIATYTGESQWLTGGAARAFGHKLRHRADAILVGVGTVLADDPQLTTRLGREVVGAGFKPAPTSQSHPRKPSAGKDPIRVVLDSRLRLPVTARVLHLNSPAPTWIACTDAAPAEKVRALGNLGAEVLVLPAEEGRVALKPLLKLLGRRQVQSVLVEGGAETLSSFFDQRLVDQFFFFYAPMFLGGKDAPGILAGAGAAHLKDALPARELTIRQLGRDLLISGYLLEDMSE